MVSCITLYNLFSCNKELMVMYKLCLNFPKIAVLFSTAKRNVV